MGFIDDLQLINLSTPNSGNGDTAYVGGGKLNGNITAIATEIDAIRLQLDNINTVKNISFLGINPDFSKRAKAFTAINALPAFSVSSIESVGFSRVYSTGIDGDVPGGGTSVGFVREWYYLKGKGKGNYGTGGVQLTASDIIVGHVESITAGVIDLGDIGINEIWDFVNDNGPYVVAGTTEFRAEQDSEDKKWVFIGNDGTYGDGELEVTAANFLEITEEPEPDFGLFITKDSKQHRDATITTIEPSQLYLTPERTTFLIKVTAGSGEINGFVDIASEIAGVITYDGMDVFIKNDSIPDVILKHNHGTAPLKFWFKSEEDFVLKQNEIVHLKVYNSTGRVEMVGNSGALILSTDQSLYLDPETNELRVNVSDFSEKYTYAAGAQEFVLTETPTKIIFISVNGQMLEDPLTQWSIDVPTQTITILDTLDSGDRVTVHYQYFIEV